MLTYEDLKKNPDQISGVEKIKIESNYLRGSINESLIDQITGSVAPDDTQLIKFHGMYQQTDRDLDSERKKQKLEPLYSFMARVRIPGGIISAAQWLAMDAIADRFANGTLKITTRQALQFHGLVKTKLKATMQEINQSLLDTLAACGDVNRNVMCSPHPYQSNIHEEVQAFARAIHTHLSPQTAAYHEIWLEKQLVAGGEKAVETEPLYSKHYLPRKFKIALSIPPYNDTDVFTNDIGMIAIEEDGKLAGYNLVAGGGMGNDIGNEKTYPRLGTSFGFIPAEDALKVVETIVLLQRNLGNREDRKTARLKYTIDRKGIDWFKQAIESQSGVVFEKERPYHFITNHDSYNWIKDQKGFWHYSIYVQNGRVKDDDTQKLRSALRDIAALNICDFRLTGNQNLILGHIAEADKPTLENYITKYQLTNKYSSVRLHSIACVALNTCTMAHAEAERYLPSLIDKIDNLCEKHQLNDADIRIRMTGCPNGCGRPYNAEIGFVGRAPGIYHMYLGGDQQGKRLNRLYKEMLDEEAILAELDQLFETYSAQRQEGEPFGDFVWRQKIMNHNIPVNL